MPVLTPVLPHPHSQSLPLPVTNPNFSSASPDGTPDAEGVASSLSTLYSMASAFTTTATDTSTVRSHSQSMTREREELEERHSYGSGKEMLNENLTSDAIGMLSDTRPNLSGQIGAAHVKDEDEGFTSGSSPSFGQSQIIDFSGKEASLHKAPHTPTSTSASISLPLPPMPSPKSDVDGSYNRTTTATKQQHRKSASMGGVISSSITLSTSSNPAHTAKVQSYTQAQHRLRSSSVLLKGRTDTMDLDQEVSVGVLKSTAGASPLSKLPQPQYQMQQLLVNTPPEMLPPSPPLTNNELEMDDDDDTKSSERDRGHDDTDADADVDTTEGHTISHSQTDSSDVQDEDDDGDVDGVNPQIEADIADGWQAPDSKLETTPGTPVLPSQSPSTTSLPLTSSSQIQGNKLAAALSKSSLSPTAPQRLTTLEGPSSPRLPLSPLRVKISSSDIDLEKADQLDHVDGDLGLGDAVAKQRAFIEAEAEESTGALGITKTFEVIRTPKRFSSPQPPRSSYYMGPPAGPTAFGSSPAGQIGLHHPREIVRVERDFDHGELVQFSSAFPLEFEGRITPTQFLETINAINEHLIRAHSLSGALFFNLLAILTLWISPFFIESAYKREMRNLQVLVDALNANLYNPRGLNILWPRRNAFLFLEIEYY